MSKQKGWKRLGIALTGLWMVGSILFVALTTFWGFMYFYDWSDHEGLYWPLVAGFVLGPPVVLWVLVMLGRWVHTGFKPGPV
jgi:hypothetical protein